MRKYLLSLFPILLLVIYPKISLAKCYSTGDRSGRIYTYEMIRKIPFFVKGRVENFTDDNSQIHFDIAVLRVLKGENVPEKIQVAMQSQKKVHKLPPEKEFKEDGIYVFGIEKIDKPYSHIVSTSCFPNLTEDEFTKINDAYREPIPKISEKEAIRIAEKKLVARYGKSVRKQRPFQAALSDGIWTITGTFHCPPKSVCKGGVAEIQISAMDGTVISVIHGK